MQKNGFTLIEVLMAMAIFMLVMMPIVDMVGLMLRQSARRAQITQRFIVAESFLAENHMLQQHGKPPITSKKISDPLTTLTYQTKEVGGDLKKFKKVMLEQVTMEWREAGRKRVERLVSCVMKPEEKES